MRRICLALLVLLFCLGSVFALSAGVPEDVLLYPDQEFYLIMTLENEGEDRMVDITGHSEGLNVSWNRSVLLLKDAGVKVGFVIDPIRDVGRYDIIWSVRGEVMEGEEPEVVSARTRVLVSDLEGTLGNVIGYYGFELDELESYGKSDYVEDAKKNIRAAQDLADRGMDFEAQKYLDFARESMERAVEEESPSKVRSWDWLGSLIALGVVVGILIVVGLIGFVLVKIFWKLKERFGGKWMVARSYIKTKGREKSVAKPKYILDVLELRKRIMRIRDLGRRKELLADLNNAEEKFRIGLPMLGRAYLERIGKRIGRGRG